ncbi:hypothetical protein QOZ88_18960 [Blastococcus sp. BMG 814]|uniref:Uncharacterized protein n=1 Tax=Blastococcus carthaginiensis TaxID=3050034 RepID=A0ABT9II22_9ACTN|nr:hypothetical protein [Blastococcus carthaginiensis]MDP5184720.1 hypothetical protein [Blastococcus carthaginiensis]
MRLSRVLLAGVAVAGVAATTSAFTASNTVPPSTAGYGSATVSGATATDIAYVLDAADKSLVDSINFEITEDITGMQAFLTLRTGAAPGTVVGTPISCVVGTRTTISPVTCSVPDQPLVSFNSIGLTIAQ